MGRRLWAWIAAGVVLLVPPAAGAASYSVRPHWQPSADSAVTAYRIYIRPAGGTFALALDAGLPALAGDGTMSAAVPGMSLCASYGVVVTAYRADGSESALSNEIAFSYATAAPLIDTDHDGLSNAAEDKDLDCVVDPGETDPTRADSDGDGILDGSDACQGTPAGVAVNANGCSCTQIVCDDGNPCTTDGCVAGQCQHAALLDGTSCSDGVYCNGAETCRSGICTAVPISCDDGNVCTADRCEETLRACAHTAIAGCCRQDADCADTSACTTNERCVSGQCVRDAVQCPAPTPCTTVSCDPAVGCRTTPLPDGTPCDDGNACTLNTTCSGGVCGTTAAAPTTVLAVTSGTRLVGTARSDGALVRAQAVFSVPLELHLTTGNVAVVLTDATGAVRYRVNVPIERFKAVGRRLVYRDLRRDENGGVVRIVLLRRVGRARLRVRASVDRLAALFRDSSTTLTWAVKSGSSCITGGGNCKGRGNRCY